MKWKLDRLRRKANEHSESMRREEEKRRRLETEMVEGLVQRDVGKWIHSIERVMKNTQSTSFEASASDRSVYSKPYLSEYLEHDYSDRSENASLSYTQPGFLVERKEIKVFLPGLTKLWRKRHSDSLTTHFSRYANALSKRLGDPFKVTYQVDISNLDHTQKIETQNLEPHHRYWSGIRAWVRVSWGNS